MSTVVDKALVIFVWLLLFLILATRGGCQLWSGFHFRLSSQKNGNVWRLAYQLNAGTFSNKWAVKVQEQVHKQFFLLSPCFSYQYELLWYSGLVWAQGLACVRIGSSLGLNRCVAIGREHSVFKSSSLSSCASVDSTFSGETVLVSSAWCQIRVSTVSSSSGTFRWCHWNLLLIVVDRAANVP